MSPGDCRRPLVKQETREERAGKGQRAVPRGLRNSSPFPSRLFHRYRDLAPQLVPPDYTDRPEVTLPYELIGSMPELKVRHGRHTRIE